MNRIDMDGAVAGVRRDVLALLRPPAMSATVWSSVMAVTIGTNLIDFATMPAIGQAPGGAFMLAALLRVVAVFFVSYALLRHLAGCARPMEIGLPFLRYIAFSLLFLIAFGIVTLMTNRELTVAAQPLERQWLILLAVMTVWGIVTVRLFAFQAALAGGVGFTGLRAVWRGQAGKAVALAAAFLALIVPLAAIHLALTLIGVRLHLGPNATAALVAIDGVVQAVQLAITCALSVVAWRMAEAVAMPADARPLRRDGPRR